MLCPTTPSSFAISVSTGAPKSLSIVARAASAPSAMRRMNACCPPLKKNCRTWSVISLTAVSFPKFRSNSVKLRTRVGMLTRPRLIIPTNAAIEVDTPVIVRTPEDTS